MSRQPSAAEVQKWSEEVAHDPGALSFVPLADAYRRQGRRDAALRVCLRGLDRHPEHVGGHALLGRLYLEMGDRSSAADEWTVVLRLDDGNFEAHRGLGFFSLERGDLASAERHLRTAGRLRPADPTVSAAQELLAEWQAEAGPTGATGTAGGSAEAAEGSAEGAGGGAGAAGGSVEGAGGGAGTAMPLDPGHIFDALGDGMFRGAVILDEQGLVVGGRLDGSGMAAEMFGAAMGPAVEEALRTAMHLGMGAWQGLTLEADSAMVHVAAMGDGYAVVVVAAPEAPTGWVVRTAARAVEIGREFIGGTA